MIETPFAAKLREGKEAIRPQGAIVIPLRGNDAGGGVIGWIVNQRALARTDAAAAPFAAPAS
jgi:hypothetical protein